MSNATDCTYNTDPLKLVLEGTSQEQRLSSSLVPAYAPVDERTVAHRMVFAQAYSAYLKYYNSTNVVEKDWQPFFGNDLSVLLAIAAVQDVDYYKSNIKEYFDYLKNLNDQSDKQKAKQYLGYLFSCAGTLAKQLDALKEGLPGEIRLKSALQNIIQSQLAPAFNRLIAYYKADMLESEHLIADVQPGMVLLGETTALFSTVYQEGLSNDWITDSSSDWNAYTGSISKDDRVYGVGSGALHRINHIATHNLFTSIFDQFLKAYARTVKEGEQALEKTLTGWDRHEPHYALFLAFLRLFEYARAEANTLTGRHLDFYYREILGLEEKDAEPGKAHLLVEPAKQVESHELKKGELFKAGKDDLGKDAFFANNLDFVANQAKVAALKTVYRHNDEPIGKVPSDKHNGRVYASPVANSDDGLGAELTSTDQSWHPFFNKVYTDGVLTEIRMPNAEVGFALASHYLLLAEGQREVTLQFTVAPPFAGLTGDHKGDVACLFTGEKGWIEKSPSKFMSESGKLKLTVTLDGADSAVIPYSTKTHGYNFATELPVLLVKLQHLDSSKYIYPQLQDLVISQIDLTVKVNGLKTLSVSNDFGPLDTSKPFQPFGPSPVANSALIIGSKEAFQKALTGDSVVNVSWQATPAPFGTEELQTFKVVKKIAKGDPTPTTVNKEVNVAIDYLLAGAWQSSGIAKQDIKSTSFPLTGGTSNPYVDLPNLTEMEHYSTSSRHGFVRLKLDADFGQSEYEQALIDYIKSVTDSNKNNDGVKPTPPIGPFIAELTLDYTAQQQILLNSADKSGFESRQSRFFHLAPFGQAEQHPFLSSSQKACLLPQFDFKGENGKQESEAEFYIGVTGLEPPQNLAVLFQVADGTANPLSVKPDPHIHWSYMRDNEWIAFSDNDLEDRTGGLLNSGIVTFAIPRDASESNTFMPSGMHWIRGAVASESDAVSRLRMVAAQALEATFTDRGNDPAFPSKVLEAGTISKLDTPDAAVKKITQPFESFGGRGKEEPTAFYTRVSERLRHKDRAIALWDYERLVLEAFPQIYKVKCLNHTQYEPSESGTGIYRELAPGHVTVVTVPNQQFQNLRDPLRPYTSLAILEEIASFLSKRLSCFVRLHVKNPEFEEVRVECKVRLYDGLDDTFYTNKLKEAITRFLSPWAFPGGDSPTFGGRIYKSALINFVEDLPYVDYVTDFRLFHTFYDSGNNKLTEEADEVEGSKAVSILVSAREHIIEIIDPAEVETPGERCLCEP